MEAIEKLVFFDEKGNAILKLGKKYSGKEAKIVVLIKNEEISDTEWRSLAMRGVHLIF